MCGGDRLLALLAVIELPALHSVSDPGEVPAHVNVYSHGLCAVGLF